MSEHNYDFLVIGSGIAGLSFALKVANEGKVAIVTKKAEKESNTNYAQGGIASVFSKDDSFSLHIQDTLRTGAGLCHQDAVELIVNEGPKSIQSLVNWGTQFTRQNNDEFHLGREGGHSADRIVHAQDLTGREIERALLKAIKTHRDIHVFEHYIVIELITEHHLDQHTSDSQIHCWGAYILDTQRGIVNTFRAKAIILCSGGCGQVYRHTTNPNVATGDGIAMAYRAGAKIANMEFMQFHPTAFYHPEGSPFLISEAVRGFGGILRTKDGKSFMENYDPKGSLAPRDIVARAIDNELKKRGDECVFIDLTHFDGGKVNERFPNIYKYCLEYKIDMANEWIPVVPAAHYICGGVVTDLMAKTSINGLFAIGEVTCTGVHGANRLASNSLLEAIVFSERCFKYSSEHVRNFNRPIPEFPDWDDSGTINAEEWILISHDKAEIQQLMWDYVGIVRSNLRLNRAMKRILLINREIEDFYRRTKVTEDLIELRNLGAVAYMIIKSALFRKESRGLHYTTDFPKRSDELWAKDTIYQEID